MRVDDLLDELPAMRRESDGPVFKEPWEASVFALTVELHQRGHFTWKEWARVLASEIKRAQESGDPDLGDTYYQHWLNALEALLTDKGLTNPAGLTARRKAWRNAYLNTPHGQPIFLENDSS